MTPSIQACSSLWKTQLDAALQYAHLVIDGAEQLCRKQTDLLRDACHLGSQEYLHLCSPGNGNYLERSSELLSRRLDLGSSVARHCLETGMEFRDSIKRIAEEQISSLTQHLQQGMELALIPARIGTSSR